MKAKALWRVSLLVPAGVEDDAAEFLAAQFDTPTVSYTDLESGRSTVCLYLEAKPANWPQMQQELTRQLRRRGLVPATDRGDSRAPAGGGTPAPQPLTLARLRQRDWAEAWKQHFRPIEIARRLLVKPSWSQRRGQRRQVVLVLDPGLSFGTGHHPTTEFCLEQVVARRVERARQSFLDIGTGSGILAIAAARLGYHPIVAFDFDPEAVRVAQANARANGVRDRIRFSRRDVRDLSVKPRWRYQLVCANLIANLLVEERDRIVAQVASDGCLVLAGILRSEFEQVIKVYQEAGLRLAASRAKKEWRSGAMVWRDTGGRWK